MARIAASQSRRNGPIAPSLRESTYSFCARIGRPLMLHTRSARAKSPRTSAPAKDESDEEEQEEKEEKSASPPPSPKAKGKRKGTAAPAAAAMKKKKGPKGK